MPKQNKFTYLKDYQPFSYEISQVEMNFIIEEKSTKCTTLLKIKPKENIDKYAPLILNGDGLILSSIKLNGAPLPSENYSLTSDELKIIAPSNNLFTLEITTILKPDMNSDLMGLYKSNGIYCTQCEPEGFRRITYFPDRPDVLSTYQVRIEADKKQCPILLANGNLVAQGDLDNNRHYAIWHDPHKKPSYLFALVAGDLGSIEDEFITKSGKKISLNIYCEHGKENKCFFAMDALKRAMKWDEECFSREYDLDIFNIVAVSDFNFGAMENKGLNIFNDRLILADPKSATDKDYERIEAVIAHEYFHNWTGNRITLKNWFQLCLKEGLTVYRDQEFTSDMHSRAIKRIEDVRLLRSVQFPEDDGPLAHPPRPDKYREIDNFYTATVYEKGAEIVRMLAIILGKKDFSKGCELYFERYDGQAITIEDWIKIFEKSAKIDLSQFIKWYFQAGTPEVNINQSWDRENKILKVKLSQKTKPSPYNEKTEPMLIPIKFGLVGLNGADIKYSLHSDCEVKGDIILFNKENAELIFTNLATRPIISFFREFSAPIKIKTNQKKQDKFFLARYDSDEFNRWQAINDLFMKILLDNINNPQRDDYYEIENLSEILSEILADKQLDNALKSLMLSVPGENILAQNIGQNIDPQKIHRVRQKLLFNIGNRLYSHLVLTYDNLAKICLPHSLKEKSVQARQLRNQALSLLLASKDKAALDLAEKQYFSADNMSDKMAVLSAMVAFQAKKAKALLKDFYNNNCDDLLIYDKYLMLNALNPTDECLDNIKAIYNSRKFPKSNPNRLRALIGTFANVNRAQFAQISGDGFAFIIDVCKEIDKINPQSAAAILSAFESWKILEPKRRQLAKEELQRLKKEKLSNNLNDILERILA